MISDVQLVPPRSGEVPSEKPVVSEFAWQSVGSSAKRARRKERQREEKRIGEENRLPQRVRVPVAQHSPSYGADCDGGPAQESSRTPVAVSKLSAGISALNNRNLVKLMSGSQVVKSVPSRW